MGTLKMSELQRMIQELSIHPYGLLNPRGKKVEIFFHSFYHSEEK